MDKLENADILNPINVRNFSHEIKNWIKYRVGLYLKKNNSSEITSYMKDEENRLRERVQIWNDIRIVADSHEDYEKILQELALDSNKKKLIIGWWAMYGVTSYLIAKNMIESWVDFNYFVWSSSGSIVAWLLATDNLSEENIEYFLKGIPEKVEPSKLWNILLIKLLPFFVDMMEHWQTLTIQEKKLLVTVFMENMSIIKLFKKGEVDEKEIEMNIKWLTGRDIRVKKQSFVDINKNYGKQLSINVTTLARRRKEGIMKKIVIPRPETLELRWWYPVIDAILHSCGASWLFNTKKIKKLNLITFDAMFNGGQYSNKFQSKDSMYTNILIHTDWFFGIMRLLLPGYWENNYVIAPRLFWTDCYNHSEKSIVQLTQIARDMINK